MRISVFFSLMLILIVVLFKGCKSPEVRVFRLNPVFKDFCIFNKGSYWIYRDSSNGALDTLTILKSEIRMLLKDDLDEEIFTCEIKSTAYPFILRCYSGNRINNQTSLQEEYTYMLVDWYMSFDSDTSDGFKSLYTSGGHYEVTNKFSKCTINSNNFDRVIVVQEKGSSLTVFNKETWWSSRVGKIKYTKGDGHVWEIVKYEIK